MIKSESVKAVDAHSPLQQSGPVGSPQQLLS